MIAQPAWMQNWLNQRTEREKLYIFVGGFAIIFMFFYVFLWRPLSLRKTNLAHQEQALRLQQTTLEQQIDQINQMIKDPIFSQLISEQKQLTTQVEQQQQLINTLKTELYSPEQLTELTKKILQLPRNNTILVSLEELPVMPWPPQSPTLSNENNSKVAENTIVSQVVGLNKPVTATSDTTTNTANPMNATSTNNTTIKSNTVDASGILNGLSSGYQHTLQIEFKNDFFNTIAYLKDLENISNHIFWDSLHYKVTDYPKANVVIQFHVITLNKD